MCSTHQNTPETDKKSQQNPSTKPITCLLIFVYSRSRSQQYVACGADRLHHGRTQQALRNEIEETKKERKLPQHDCTPVDQEKLHRTQMGKHPC